MKTSRFFSGLCLFLGLGLAFFSICLVMGQPGTQPTLIGSTQAPRDQVVAAMDAICAGDFSGAQQYLLGQPSLGVDRELEDPAAAMIWQAFVQSLSYELSGECYATDTGVAQDITLTCLDITSVTANLAQRSEKHLTRLQKEATHISELYDDDGNYRQDVVMKVLSTVVKEALKEDSQQTTCTFTLQLVSRKGQWYIRPNSEFISALLGGI